MNRRSNDVVLELPEELMTKVQCEGQVELEIKRTGPKTVPL